MKTRTNWERVAELNEILGPIKDKFGYYFGILKNAKDFRYPYCLCYSYEVKISLGFKDMKGIAERMRAAYDNGGDRMAVYNEIYA